MAGKRAVVLFNLGGPDGPDAVEPFLYNLFSDPAIISLPNPLRWFIAKTISRKRAPIAREIYGNIGGRSPLVPETEAQAAALESLLNGAGKPETKVFICMRYWHPMSAETAKAVADFAPDEVIELPLYPQYSTTTSASSLKDWRKAARSAGVTEKMRAACCYPTAPGLIAAEADLVATATMSRDPLVLGAWVNPGTHVDLVGAYTPAMRESDDALITREHDASDGEGHCEAHGADADEDGDGHRRVMVGVPHEGHHRAPHARGAWLGLGSGLGSVKVIIAPHTHEVPGECMVRAWSVHGKPYRG